MHIDSASQWHTHCVSVERTGSFSMSQETQCEDTLSTMVLENIKNKLLHAFRTTGETRPALACCSGASLTCIGKNAQANEELRRAKIDGAITWIRSELLEMRSQDRQLAQTLLGLGREIQRLRGENGLAAPLPEPEDDQNT